MAECLAFGFDYDASVAEFAVSKRSYLAARPGISFGYIATSTLVLDMSIASDCPRVLLLQRAACDEDPNKWEPPGGACDDDDVTILHGAARELWEEAGLQAVRFIGLVGLPHFFTLEDGKKVCQFNFAVQVKNDSQGPLAVRLDPEEHQCFVWVTESEVQAKNAADLGLDFTRCEVEHTVLLVFEDFRKKQTQACMVEEKDLLEGEIL
jgi:8-oxo-dGTP pyrophosphatase MutT (NUDIX family)